MIRATIFKDNGTLFANVRDVAPDLLKHTLPAEDRKEPRSRNFLACGCFRRKHLKMLNAPPRKHLQNSGTLSVNAAENKRNQPM